MKRILKSISCLLLLCIFSACDTSLSDVTDNVPTQAVTEVIDDEPIEKKLTVTFFDVGKADFILVQTDGKTAVIDTGYDDNWDTVKEELKKRNIENIEYLIATHPDKDHIGCMNKVMKNFNVNTLYVCPLEADSKEYEKMMKAADKYSVQVKNARDGDTFSLGAARFLTVSPNDELLGLNDENEASVVLLMTFGERKVLFSADAQKEAESMMTYSEYDISADVIKIGHHGSAQSSSAKYLEKVGAKYAVISTGEQDGEKYVSSDVIKKLNDRDMKIYRTDLQGNIIMYCDGERIEFETQY